MKDKTMVHLKNLIKYYPQLECCKNDIYDAYNKIYNCFEQRGVLLICGNGGSSADADHIVGELMKGFLHSRKISDELATKIKMYNGTFSDQLQLGLPAINLSSHNSLITAIANDNSGDLIFAQQILGYGNPKNTLLCISTSGNSTNVINAAIVSKAIGMIVIALTGKDGGRLKEIADTTIIVQEYQTHRIQELHLPIYHALCAMLEEEMFGIE